MIWYCSAIQRCELGTILPLAFCGVVWFARCDGCYSARRRHGGDGNVVSTAIQGEGVVWVWGWAGGGAGGGGGVTYRLVGTA